MNRIIFCLSLILLLILAPLFLTPSLLNAAIQMLIAILFASAFNILAGQGGMLSFGHSAYFAIGTFATIHAMNAIGGLGLLPTPLLPIIGLFAGCILGLIAGWFSTYHSGVYFAMITLALAELLHSLAPHLKDFFGGEGGVSAMRMPAWGIDFATSSDVYYLCLFWVIVAMALMYYFTGTPLGRLNNGLRENTNRLRFLGYNVHTLRVMVFTISASFSGLAGGLQAMNNEAANYILFDMALSTQAVLNSYIGGIGSFYGPAIGAAIMTFFGYAVSDLTRSWLLYQGIIFVLVMMFLPSGLFSIVQWWEKNNQKHKISTLITYLFSWAVSLCVGAIGSVFFVELLGRVLDQDYQAVLKPDESLPNVSVLGMIVEPASIYIWVTPLVFIAVSIYMTIKITNRWRLLNEETD